MPPRPMEDTTALQLTWLIPATAHCFEHHDPDNGEYVLSILTKNCLTEYGHFLEDPDEECPFVIAPEAVESRYFDQYLSELMEDSALQVITVDEARRILMDLIPFFFNQTAP